MSRWAPALALLALSCPPPPLKLEPSPCRLTPRGELFLGALLPFRGPQLSVAGDEATVDLSIAVICPDEVDVRAEVTAVGPDNLEVLLLDGSSERAVTERSSDDGMKTQVKVLTATPGPYHFTARFEPNVGVVQVDLIAAENRRDAGAHLEVVSAPLAQCRHVDVSAGGRLLCLEGGARVYSADGGLSATLAASGVAARAGAVIWTWSQGALERWVETDAGFAASLDGGLPTGSMTAPLLLPEPDDVMLVAREGIFHVRVAPPQMLRLGDFGFEVPQPYAAWRHGDEYVLLTFENTLCYAHLGDGGECGKLIGHLIGDVVGSEPSVGIWVATNTPPNGDFLDTLSLARPRHEVEDFKLHERWSMPDGGRVPPYGNARSAWDEGASLRNPTGDHMLVSYEQGKFKLRKYDSNLRLLSVTGTWDSFSEPATDRVLIFHR